MKRKALERSTGGARQRARVTTGERADVPQKPNVLSKSARRKARRYGKLPAAWR